MATTTLSLSSPLFLAAPARARDVALCGVPSASTSWSTANALGKGYMVRVHERGQQRRMAIVSVIGRKSTTRETVVPDPVFVWLISHQPAVLVSQNKSAPAKRTGRIGYQLLYLVSSEVRIAGAFAYADNLLAAAPVGLLGLLLLFQTTRVRFVFDNEALEVKVGDQLQESGENVFVGGKNCWKYSTFINWELWWPQFPILVYFKESQTKPKGQIHFFPVIFNGRQLYDVMVERAGPSKMSGPK